MERDTGQSIVEATDGGGHDDAAVPFTWRPTVPETQGIDSRHLTRALRALHDDGIALHSLIIVRNGDVVLEVYAPPYDRNTLHNVKSVSKSIMSALVGVALREGLLTGLDQTVHQAFPEYIADDTDPRKKSITLRHLLTMTSGLDLDENGPIWDGIVSSDDWIKAALDRPMSADPGERFLYSTALTHIVSGILSRASGRRMLKLCRDHLFDPLGIGEVQWRQDPQGYDFGGAELFMRPRDMAAFGLLYLNGGRWNGRQIVPAAWVEESTGNQMQGVDADDRYGYWWWRDLTGDIGYRASGWGGQHIVVLPGLNMVVAANFGDPNGLRRFFEGFDVSRIGSETLPPNPEAARELQALVSTIQHPEPTSVPELPPLTRDVTGRAYQMDGTDRTSPYDAITFDFDRSDRAWITLATKDGSHRLAIGLDGLYRSTASGLFGRMPCDNRIALRGRWTDDSTFTMDWIDVGDPNHARLVFSFCDDEIVVDVDVDPAGEHVMLRGSCGP
ncbi:MAG: serine hydrolase [Pseudomonadota bacterium]